MLSNIQRSFRRLTLQSIAGTFGADEFGEGVNSDVLLSESLKPRKRTKTVCTLGYIILINV